MSTDHPISFKKLILDAAFSTYSAAIIAYLFISLAHALGLTSFILDKDFAIAQMDSLFACALVGFLFFTIMAYVFHLKKISTLGDFLFATPLRKQELADLPFFKSFWGLHVLLVFLFTLIVSLQVTQWSFTELLDEAGLAGAGRLFQGLAQPNFALLPTAIAEIFETIFIAFLGTVMAIPIAFVLAFFCAKNIMTGRVAAPVYFVLRTLLNVTRSVEPLIWAIIFSVWVGVGPFAGMLALLLHSIASLTKQYSEIMESVSDGPIEGIRSTGANTIQTLWFAVVPQVVLPYIAFTVYRWDINVRMATVIGLVGGGGIGTMLIRYQGQAMWPEVGCIILVIAVVVWLMDTASAHIREALK